MSASTPFTCRRIRSSKRWAVATLIAMVVSTVSPVLGPTVHAQTAPVGAGFVLDAEDLRFIFHAIEIAQQHSVTRTNANPCGAARARRQSGPAVRYAEPAAPAR